VKKHEERHAIQGIIGPRSTILRVDEKRLEKASLIRKRIRKISESEAVALEQSNPILKSYDTGKNAHRVRMAIKGQTIARGPLGLANRLPELIQSSIFHSIAKKHGEDGAILFWASPPRNKKGQISTNFWGWEKRMITLGYLRPSGGLTRAGIGFLRTQMTTHEIIIRLERAKKRRNY
jgi:hypothetical protein